MEKIFRQSLLFDFYGELLTEHQKSIYEDVVMNDLSYSEIARENGISRQGVYDMMKRSDKILEEYEAKLRLVEKFVSAREKLSLLHDNAISLKAELDKMPESASENVRALVEEIEQQATKLVDEF